MIQPIFTARFLEGEFCTVYFSELGKRTKSNFKQRPITGASNARFRFKILYVWKPARLKVDCVENRLKEGENNKFMKTCSSRQVICTVHSGNKSPNPCYIQRQQADWRQTVGYSRPTSQVLRTTTACGPAPRDTARWVGGTDWGEVNGLCHQLHSLSADYRNVHDIKLRVTAATCGLESVADDKISIE